MGFKPLIGSRVTNMNSNNMEDLPPPRPYTEYNMFFQIEREYILQNLGVVPDIKEGEEFSTSDPRYKGPELPSRYDGIRLPSDWYIPGKGRRKKRQHRASHGKISFTDLSKSISSAWRNIDNETKLFCAQLSDIGNQKYKKEMHRRKSDSSLNSETKSLKKKTKPTARASTQNKQVSATVTSNSTMTNSNVSDFASSSTSTDARRAIGSAMEMQGQTSTSFMRPDFYTSYSQLLSSAAQSNSGIYAQSSSALSNPGTAASSNCNSARPNNSDHSCGSEPQELSDVDLSSEDILNMYYKS